MSMKLADPSIALLPPDWSQMLPDALIAIVVGAGVAWFISSRERKATDRADKQIAEIEWSFERPQVAGAVDQDLYRESALLSLDQLVDPHVSLFFEAVKDLPLGRWREATPDNKQIAAAAEALTAAREYRTIASGLDQKVWRFYAETLGLPNPKVEAAKRFTNSSIAGLSNRNAMAARFGAVEEFEEMRERLLADEDFAAHSKRALIALERVEASWSAMRSALH